MSERKSNETVEIRFGERVLAEEDGVKVNIFNSSNHPYGAWGRKQRWDLGNIKGEIEIQEGTPAYEAYQELRKQEMQKAGRSDGNYINLPIKVNERNLVIRGSSWRFDKDTKTWRRKLY